MPARTESHQDNAAGTQRLRYPHWRSQKTTAVRSKIESPVAVEPISFSSPNLERAEIATRLTDAITIRTISPIALQFFVLSTVEIFD